MDPADQPVVIGEILRAHGVHGAMRVRATGATLGALHAGDTVLVGGRDMGVRAAVRAGVLELVGVDDRAAADALRGRLLEVPASRLPAPAESDAFYVRDLVGCTVFVGDAPAGVVGQVLERPANDVLEVVRDGGGESLLLPFTRDAVVAVDLAARVIRVRGDLLGGE